MERDLRADALNVLLRGIISFGPIAFQLLLRKLEEKERDSLNRHVKAKSEDTGSLNRS